MSATSTAWIAAHLTIGRQHVTIALSSDQVHLHQGADIGLRPGTFLLQRALTRMTSNLHARNEYTRPVDCVAALIVAARLNQPASSRVNSQNARTGISVHPGSAAATCIFDPSNSEVDWP